MLLLIRIRIRPASGVTAPTRWPRVRGESEGEETEKPHTASDFFFPPPFCRRCQTRSAGRRRAEAEIKGGAPGGRRAPEAPLRR